MSHDFTEKTHQGWKNDCVYLDAASFVAKGERSEPRYENHDDGDNKTDLETNPNQNSDWIVIALSRSCKNAPRSPRDDGPSQQ